MPASDAGPEAAALLTNGSSIQQRSAGAQGARRHAQGWGDAARRRDHRLCREEVERAVRSRRKAAGAARALGIRIALGARSGHVVATVARHALVRVAVRIGVGLVGAALLSRFGASLLFGVGAREPASYAAAVPAWRATRVNPEPALRNE